MYRCASCSRVVPPRARALRVIVERRSTTYPMRPGANRLLRKPTDSKRKKRKVLFTHDPGGQGFEAAREAIVCPECADSVDSARSASGPGATTDFR